MHDQEEEDNRKNQEEEDNVHNYEEEDNVTDIAEANYLYASRVLTRELTNIMGL